jgi:glycosyltransferase involved in cell wall biosynthesis
MKTESRKNRAFKTSVAIPTYNGEKYIIELLSSIIKQSLPVHEIVVSDDGSQDQSIKVIEDFLTNSDVRLRIYNNQDRHGPTGNYINAIRHCTGDIIFLADQDDVWPSDRCERYIQQFLINPDTALVAADSLIVSEDLSASLGTYWRRNRLHQYPPASTRNNVLNIVKQNIAAHQIAFRASCIEDVIDIGGDFYIEDWCLWACEMSGHSQFIPAALTHYRRHPAQHTRNDNPTQPQHSAVGPQSSILLENLRRLKFNIAAVQARYLTKASMLASNKQPRINKKITQISRYVDYTSSRIRFYELLSERPRPFSASRIFIAMTFSHYFQRGNGLSTVLKDAFALIKVCKDGRSWGHPV